MIHQFIFAYPRPGMSEPEFQQYWLNVHAVNYASKIPQIRKYMVDTRIALPGETENPLWCGVAEIWLENEKEQLESLQSKEFLEGARLDEPKWAAFWRTVVMDTTAHELLPPSGTGSERVKLLVLSKRKEGLPLEKFRAHFLEEHAEKALALPGLCGYQQGHVREGAYAIGEAVLDCVEQFWFEDADTALAAQRSRQQSILDEDYRICAEQRYIHSLLVREHWIIGPEAREYKSESNAVLA